MDAKQDSLSPRVWLVDAVVSIASIVGILLSPVLAIGAALLSVWFLIFWLTIGYALFSALF
jgi:hypothetical protein